MYYVAKAERLENTGPAYVNVEGFGHIAQALGAMNTATKSTIGVYVFTLDIIKGAALVAAFEAREDSRAKDKVEIPWGVDKQVLLALRNYVEAEQRKEQPEVEPTF